MEGGDVLARWTHTFDQDSDWSLQSYFDRARRDNTIWDQNVNTFDVEFQHRFPITTARRHEIIWGADYRQIHDDEITQGFAISLEPPKMTTSQWDVFAQDQVTLVDDRLFFIVGSKFGHNDYSGFEYQPNGRLLYTPDNKQTLWAAISRAVRTPDRFERDGFVTGPPTQLPPGTVPSQYFLQIDGNPNLPSENVIAYEIGYRAQPDERFAYDVALFYNVYENQLALQPGTPFIDGYGNLIVPMVYINGTMHGRTAGKSAANGGCRSAGGLRLPTATWRCSRLRLPPTTSRITFPEPTPTIK